MGRKSGRRHKMKAWITRDSRGKVYLFRDKPTKGAMWWVGGSICLMHDDDLPEGINPQWTDAEPVEIELKIEKVD